MQYQAHNSCLTPLPFNYFVLSYVLLVYLANFSFQSNFCERFIYIPPRHLFNIQISKAIRGILGLISPHNTPFPSALHANASLCSFPSIGWWPELDFPLQNSLVNSNGFGRKRRGILCLNKITRVLERGERE